MLIVTTNEVPGYRIAATLGECFGLTVRSRNAFSNIGAGFKAMAGGELKGITTLLHDCRQEALQRLAAEAGQRGANAVVAFRFETTEYGGSAVEVCAYGTAVGIEPIGGGPVPPAAVNQQAGPPPQMAPPQGPPHGHPQGPPPGYQGGPSQGPPPQN